MPDMNGFELLAEIRKIKSCDGLPVVFLTADSDRETEVRVFRDGAQDYIQKPLVPEVVLERIKRILSLQKLQDSLESEVVRRWEAHMKDILVFENAGEGEAQPKLVEVFRLD